MLETCLLHISRNSYNSRQQCCNFTSIKTSTYGHKFYLTLFNHYNVIECLLEHYFNDSLRFDSQKRAPLGNPTYINVSKFIKFQFYMQFSTSIFISDVP